MTIIVCFVDLNFQDVKISERFLGFVPILDTTSLGLTEVVFKQLQEIVIPVEDIRGQGYDNGRCV